MYEEHYGPIPLDDCGRAMEIHHIDGNHNNNALSNLKLVSIVEHYEIHRLQNDLSACYYMALRMKLTSKEISEIATKRANERVKAGTHNFVTNNPVYRQLENGHHFTGGEIQRKNIEAGTHNFVTNNPGSIPWICEVCGKHGKGKGQLTSHRRKCKSSL